MKPRQLTLVLVLLIAVGNISEVSAQGWLKQLGKKAEEAAKQKVEEKVQEKTRKAVDKTFDEVEDLATQKNKKNPMLPSLSPPIQVLLPITLQTGIIRIPIMH